MLFDLTQTLNESTPVYPGDSLVKLEPEGTIESDGFAAHILKIGTHIGTHMDAPAHMLDGGKGLRDYPVDRFIVKAVCIDVRSGFDTEKIAGVVTEEGFGVLFYTGVSDYYAQEKYWHEYLVPDEATIKLLIEKKVSIVGVDTGSFDMADNFPVHKALLGADILLIENLTNLASLAGKRFELYALPIKLEQDGAPARVIAKTA